MSETADVRLWAMVEKTDGCWMWTGHTVIGGYGRLKDKGKHVLAHRLSWTLVHGEIPAGLDVLHKCDNPPCVRPDHLFLGNDQDNCDDKVAKRRHAFGENHGPARLTESDAIDIITLSAFGASYRDLGDAFCVSANTASQIGKRTWKHLVWPAVVS